MEVQFIRRGRGWIEGVELPSIRPQVVAAMASSFSTPATLALVAAQGPPPSFTQPPGAPPLTRALAARHQAPTSAFRIATYNLGVVRQSRRCTEKMELFHEVLRVHLGNLEAARVQVLCFQEVNAFWRSHLQKLLPAWKLSYAAPPTGVIIAHKEHHWDRVQTASLPCFPPKDVHNPHRVWRRFLQVSAGQYSLRSFA